MKEQLIEQFLKDVSDCGLYFNNARRVYDECYLLLKDAGYPVNVVDNPRSPFHGNPQLEQDPKVTMLVDEAYEAAFTYIRTRPDVEQKLQEHAKSLEQQRVSEERYYQKHGTQGEF